MNGGFLLTVERLRVAYGAITALDDVTLTVGAGEVVAIVGANGAGKTTLLRTLSGLLRPAAGEIRFNGERLDGLAPDAIVRRGLIHVPEGRCIFPEMTVRENLRLGACLRRDAAAIARDEEKVLNLFPRLRERLAQRGGTISGGEQQMLAIARGLLARPTLLLLDEPSMGLAPKLVREIFRIVGEISRDGVTVLLVEQNAHLALAAAQRAYILGNGRVLMDGAAENFADDPRVRDAYLS